MGVEHRVERIDPGVKQLFAQVGRGVDQNASDTSSVAPFRQQ
jgi:hypothetical protein